MSDDVLDFGSAPVSSEKSLKKQYSAQAATKLQEDLEAVNKEFAVVQYGGAVFIMNETKSTFYLMNKNDFLLLFNNRYYEDFHSGEAKKLGPKWLAWSNRRGYRDVVFRPSSEAIDGVYNRWKGFAFTIHNTPSGSCDLFLDHIHANIAGGNNVVYNWILDWLADMVQKPWRKPWTAVVLRSDEEGTGKGFFARHLGKLLGPHFMAIEKAGQLIGKFNAHLEDKLLLFVDEGSLTEDKAADFLKSLVTEPSLNIEGKGKPVRDVQSYHRLIIASNHEQVIRAGLHDRRYLVCQVAPNAQGKPEYFAAIEDQLCSGEVENAGYETLLYFLKNRKYDERTIQTPPSTEAMASQKIFSLDEEVRWWYDCLCLGRVGEWEWTLNAIRIDTKIFYQAYIAWCDRVRPLKRLDESRLSRALNKKAGTILASESDGINPRHYFMVRLDEARTAFEEKLGHNVNWSE